MAETTITGLPTAATIDKAQDWLPIDTTSLNTTQKINRNTFLGITGDPIGDTDSQSVSNKTIGNTNTATLKDTLFTLQDDADTTKQAKFQLSGITTATTRTYTLPNASSTLADTSTAQTFTNKTLTSPAITGGTIDNSTITVDSIGGHTTPTVVTVAGLQISSGVLSTNNSVVTANIADSAITPAKLTSGAGTGWSWSTWTPTWTNLTVGNGTVTAKYVQTGKTVFYTITFVMGSTSAVTGDIIFTLPVTAISYTGVAGMHVIGHGRINDVGTSVFSSQIVIPSTTTGSIRVVNASATYATLTATSSTVPMTWSAANNDEFSCDGFYEAA